MLDQVNARTASINEKYLKKMQTSGNLHHITTTEAKGDVFFKDNVSKNNLLQDDPL